MGRCVWFSVLVHKAMAGELAPVASAHKAQSAFIGSDQHLCAYAEELGHGLHLMRHAFANLQFSGLQLELLRYRVWLLIAGNEVPQFSAGLPK